MAAMASGVNPNASQNAPIFTGAPTILECEELMEQGGCRELSNIKPSARSAAVTQTVGNLLDMPIAAVDFFEECKLRVAEAAGWKGGNVIDRNLALCSWILLPLRPECLVINDLSADGRFKEHPAVADGPRFRFYAGAPLLTDTGYRLGTLYVGSTLSGVPWQHCTPAAGV